MKHIKLFEEFVTEGEEFVTEGAAKLTLPIQYTTYDEEATGFGKNYRLKSDEVDLPKVLYASRYKHGTSFGLDEVGFDSASERKEFINILKKMDKQGKLLQYTGDLDSPFYKRRGITTPDKLRKYDDSRSRDTSNRGNDWTGPDIEFDSKR
jgi:hypothetical protein